MNIQQHSTMLLTPEIVGQVHSVQLLCLLVEQSSHGMGDCRQDNLERGRLNHVNDMLIPWRAGQE